MDDGPSRLHSLQEAAARDEPAELWMSWTRRGGSEGSLPNGKLFRQRSGMEKEAEREEERKACFFLFFLKKRKEN